MIKENQKQETHKFKNSPLGRIPAEWDIVELGRLRTCNEANSNTAQETNQDFYGGSIPFVQTGDVANANRNLNSFSQTLNEGIKGKQSYSPKEQSL